MSGWDVVTVVTVKDKGNSHNNRETAARSNNNPTAVTVRGERNHTVRNGGQTSALAPANGIGVGPSRHELVALATSNPGAVHPSMALAAKQQSSLLSSVFGGSDISCTFWKPNAAKHEKGLLEALHARKHANDTYLLVSTRPPQELACNFSTPDHRLFNINSDAYKVSRTARAVRAVNDIDDDLNMTGRDMKNGLKDALPLLTVDEYHLMRYRDYSDWAIGHYWKQAKKDGLMGSKYVEKCFAMRVGTEPGALIEITEAQLIRGHEILIQQAINNPLGDNNDPHNLKSFALTTDQFNTLRSLADPPPNTFVHGAQGANPHYPYDYPSAWDWTPAAIQRRINYFLEQKYKALGRFIVKALIVGCVGYFVVGYLRSGSQRQRIEDRQPVRSSRYSRMQARLAGTNNVREPEPSFLSAIFSLNPKAVFDYALAPSK